MTSYWFRIRVLIQLTRGKFGLRELQEGKCENTGKRMLQDLPMAIKFPSWEMTQVTSFHSILAITRHLTLNNWT